MQSRLELISGFAGGLAAGLVGGTFFGVQGFQRFKPGTRFAYSQGGEDLVVANLFELLDIPLKSYLDIGAFEPIFMNNTYLAYTQGARGVLVEPNVDLIPALKKARPGDVVLTAGIGFTGDKEADFYRLTLPEWNTFSKEEAEACERDHPGGCAIEEVIKMPLLDINDVMAEHFDDKPNFVSLDTEGLDFDILKTFDFGRFRPEVFCVETLIQSTKAAMTDTIEFMLDHGYTPRGGSAVNTVFVDSAILR